MPRRPKTPEQIEHDRRYRQMHLDLMKMVCTTPPSELTDEDLLAVLLSFSMRKCDYREAARKLFQTYGTLNNILDARPDALLTIEPFRLNTVLMLKGIPAIYQHMLIERRPKRMRIKTPQDAETYLRPYFIGYNYEQAYLLLLNDYYYPKNVILLNEGYGTEVYIDPAKVFHEILMSGCKKVVLAHSHIDFVAIPSVADKLTTKELTQTMNRIGIVMLDHLIFARDKCYHLSSDEEMDKTVLGFSTREPVSIFFKRKK